MSRIINISLEEAKHGDHPNWGENTILIQITDPAYEAPETTYPFKTKHHFEFLDIDNSDLDKHNWEMEEFAITDEQAKALTTILDGALRNNQDVIVHCHAGICRSGAVVEVAEAMGFQRTTRFRAPNLRVKHLMLKSIGLTYDSEEKPYQMHEGEKNFGGSFGLWN